MQRTIQISTPAHNGLYDITRQVEAIVTESGVQSGMVNAYAQVATAAIMIIENWNHGGAYNIKMVMSHDGIKLAIVDDEDIGIYDMDTKELKQITDTVSSCFHQGGGHPKISKSRIQSAD